LIFAILISIKIAYVLRKIAISKKNPKNPLVSINC